MDKKAEKQEGIVQNSVKNGSKSKRKPRDRCQPVKDMEITSWTDFLHEHFKVLLSISANTFVRLVFLFFHSTVLRIEYTVIIKRW